MKNPTRRKQLDAACVFTSKAELGWSIKKQLQYRSERDLEPRIAGL